MQPLAGRRVLLVEDEYFIVDDLARAFSAKGAEVLGPVASVADAFALISRTDRIDGAVLDITLQDANVFSVADALAERGVPFIFSTGYEKAIIPERFVGIVRCEKPVDPLKVVAALFG